MNILSFGNWRTTLSARIFVFSALTSLIIPSLAFGEDEASVLRRLETKYGEVTAMQAQFSQITQSELYGETKQEGELILKRPAKMHWSFTGDGKKFITNGASMWIYNPKEKQVLRYDDISSARSPTDSLLQSLDKLGEHFEIKVESQSEELLSLDLTPKTEGQVKTVRLQLNDNLELKHLRIVDSFDNISEIAFEKVTLNVDVADSVFEFKAPEGTEVITSGGI